ncbi:hypothetical protein GHT09_015803 [Marmota monax]|uniref:LRRCT domain-containing protein n=1 Tax=Marmota monax TaxID=9995 RepID=A0A834QAY6_MARMO|nr:hypothetical protein GHT09_015803 [Marmota monax]
MLPTEALAPLHALQYLRLNDNPWVCDYLAHPFWAWLQQFRCSSSEMQQFQCSSSEMPCKLPMHLAGCDFQCLVANDLEGSAVEARPFHPIWTSVATDEELLGLPKCCQPFTADKASVLESGRPASAGNTLKRRVPPGDSPEATAQAHVTSMTLPLGP